MFVTKKSLARRTFMQGMGAVVGLPLLEAMVPAMTATAATAANPRTRFGAVYVPHGVILEQWTPKTVGKGFDFLPVQWLGIVDRSRNALLLQRHGQSVALPGLQAQRVLRPHRGQSRWHLGDDRNVRKRAALA